MLVHIIVKDMRSMDMTIDQQVALDEALVPHASRLRIRKSNFQLRSDITYKESTLQLVKGSSNTFKAYSSSINHSNLKKTVKRYSRKNLMACNNSDTRSAFDCNNARNALCNVKINASVDVCFKMDNKKCIVNLEYFREMLHICPRLLGQTFDELPFEEEILAFLRFLGYSGEIRKLTDVNINKLHQPWRLFAAVINKCLSGKSTGYDSQFVYQVEHKDAKKSNEMYYPCSQRDDLMFKMIKLVSRHQNTQLFGVMLPVELTNEDIRNFEAYKEYYAIASGAAPPKTKASVRKTKSSLDTTITPPTDAGTRLSTSAKGKQPAKSSKAKGLTVLSEVEMTMAKHMKLAMKRSLQQTHISQASGSGADERTVIIPGVPNVPTDESNEEISWKSSDEDDDDDDEVDERSDDQDTDNDGDDFVHPKLSIHKEEAKDEESFDPIVQTPKNSDDEELYRDVNINLEGRDVQMKDVHTTQEFEDTHVTLTLINCDGQQQNLSVSSKFVTSMLNPSPDAGIDSLFETTPRDLPSFGSLFGFNHRLKTLEANFLEFLQTNQFAGAVSSILGIVERYMDQRMNEAVKILIKKMESNKSIHRSNEQRNLYKALFDAYECDKIILDIYEDTVTLKRRRDDADKDKEPSAGSDRGSKRRREGKEPESTSAPKEKATKTTGKSTQGSKSHQKTLQKKPPTPDRAWNKTMPATHESIQPWISDLAKQADSRSTFNELMDTHVDFSAFLMNRLKVETLTPELLAGLTYELMKGSCKSLVELKFFLEEVYKETTDQLDWNNHEGQQCPKPLPLIPNLIPNSQGRRIIPFDHFINNDLEYLRGGASSRKYTTSVTKTKAADYGYIKWIEDLVPRIMWILEPVSYDKYALWGISHWGRKRKQFYGFAVNRELARDVYSKRRIIAAIWRKCDKERAATMIQAIDKQLKTKRIMQSLEKFVGGRLYEGDFKMLQRTI
nr:hypothetical protein [Tanacetum cinerariifolium]